MAWAKVQEKLAFSVGSSTPRTVVFDSSVTVNNLIIVAVNTYQGDISAGGVTDNKGNTYTRIYSRPTSNNAYQTVWWAKATTGGSSFTVTANMDGTDNYTTVGIVEFSGTETSSPVDAFNSQIQATFSPTSPSITTTQANDLLIGIYTDGNSGNTITAGAGWTQSLNDGGSGAHNALFIEVKNAPTATGYTSTCAITTNNESIMGIVAIKEASSGSNLTLNPTGQEITAEQGTPAHTRAHTPSGQEATAEQGTATFRMEPTVTGQQATAELGTPTLQFGVQITPVGVEASAELGTAQADSSVQIGAGVEASAELGTPTAGQAPNDVTINVTGLQASTELGTPVLLFLYTPTGVQAFTEQGTPTLTGANPVPGDGSDMSAVHRSEARWRRRPTWMT